MKNRKKLSLFELSQKIQAALDSSFPLSTWIVAEISELKENRSGHCYLELAEKDEGDHMPKAKARAIIWSGTYRMLKPFFETSTGRTLSEGIKILVNCDVNYHPVYGLSLTIRDIDPTFTIGDIEQQKQLTISKLIADGVFDMNKQIPLPLLPKNIAIISSPSAAGYQDFVHQIENNPDGYKVNHKLFSAIMQGEKGEESIIEALNLVYDSLEVWDLVVIIRGGGSQIDLGCFESYQLACNIAQFPSPIITGIGHEKDVSIADMVAHTSLKTPTAAAEFILNRFEEAENQMLTSKERFVNAVNEALLTNSQVITDTSIQLAPMVRAITSQRENKLLRHALFGKEIVTRIVSKNWSSINIFDRTIKKQSVFAIDRTNQIISTLSHRAKTKPKILVAYKKFMLKYIEKATIAHDPLKVLERGYSITRKNGQTIKNASDVKPNEIIETTLAKGMLVSSVERAQNQG